MLGRGLNEGLIVNKGSIEKNIENLPSGGKNNVKHRSTQTSKNLIIITLRNQRGATIGEEDPISYAL